MGRRSGLGGATKTAPQLSEGIWGQIAWVYGGRRWHRDEEASRIGPARGKQQRAIDDTGSASRGQVTGGRVGAQGTIVDAACPWCLHSEIPTAPRGYGICSNRTHEVVADEGGCTAAAVNLQLNVRHTRSGDVDESAPKESAPKVWLRVLGWVPCRVVKRRGRGLYGDDVLGRPWPFVSVSPGINVYIQLVKDLSHPLHLYSNKNRI